MKGIVRYFYNLAMKIFFYSYYAFLSVCDDIKTKKIHNVVHKAEFSEGKVMLLALYEKNELRRDTIELLKEAKSQGIYIVAVNTLRLSAENYQPELIDVYIERDNFGRDFGSYKTGMNYIYQNKIAEKCQRLLIINDSVFFSKRGLKRFISQLYNTETEVLGATENREISHHLGSFCISVTGNLIRKDKFRDFWENYKLSNVRPFVIKRGEFKLSLVLKSLVSTEENFKALYDVNYFEKVLTQDESLFKNYFVFRREGDRQYWTSVRFLIEYFESDFVLKSYYRKYLKDLDDAERPNQEIEVRRRRNDKNDDEIVEEKIDFVSFATFMTGVNFEALPHGNVLKRRLMSIYLDDFTRGSQIHNNCIALHYLGLPIIKLDLIYRSVCNFSDLLKLKDQIDESQQDEFMTLMMSRLSGGKFLFGMKRKAYDWGIL
ncbi:hypothetical protein LU604_08915 [Erwinia tracheiphila]|uniref:Rhamnan synthesis protein F n=1 Tax=Erwinia tracheiphila TaxID=65700 RepID=A0A345CSE8_9GAMM|nr:rhamnan synthesis F family protein [Erwinia tracheiphila]AXF76365.1 hypothetical protein AV903_10385 [Erwinia tracheiphila]UIA84977.1 hypothetical protein LU604_08915 [Erwinia tracheiphila]UIA93573.1 hypothetical protein LU632_08875 [Erwinia tracheiphila]